LPRFIKYIIIFLTILLVYISIPRGSDRLLYFPKPSSKNYYGYFKKQDIPINKFDAFVLSFFDIKEGWIRSEGLVNKYDIFKLALSPKIKKSRVMVAFGGETIELFAKQIAKQANLDSKKILKIYHNLTPLKEGAILASRYKIPYNATEQSIIAYMLAKSQEYFKSFAKTDSSEFKKRLIVASIIQKETQYKSEMPLIASVIYNRLEKDMKLQMDATLNYGKNSNKIVTPALIKKDNSKYNTYKSKGLPPEPLCFVSKSALEAAFNPAKSDYLYFVQGKNGHIFSKKYTSHKENVKIYKNTLYAKRVAKVLKSPPVIKLPSLIFVPKIETIKLK
jgi:UPF0755 protein